MLHPLGFDYHQSLIRRDSFVSKPDLLIIRFFRLENEYAAAIYNTPFFSEVIYSCNHENF